MKHILFWLLCGLVTPAAALTLPLHGVATRVRTHHPMLKAARLAIAEAQGRQTGSGRLANPVAGIDWRTESRVEPSSGLFSLEQSFPLTRRLSLEKKHSAQLVEAAQFEVRDVERRLIADAQEHVVRLLTLTQQKTLRQEQTELAKKLAEFAEGRAKAGELSPLDAKQVRLDAQRLQIESRLLEAQRVSLLGQLKPLAQLLIELVVTNLLQDVRVSGLVNLERFPAVWADNFVHA